MRPFFSTLSRHPAGKKQTGACGSKQAGLYDAAADAYPEPMKDPVYKTIELTGTSTTTMEDAVSKAIQRAHKTIKNLSWFQVTETRGNIEKGKVHHWQVTVKIGFAVND